MRIDGNVTVEDLKKKTKESFEIMNQKYNSQDLKELETSNSGDNKSASSSSKVRLGWK